MRLLLLRHAKSDWSGGEASDHARPLAPRGREAARRMGAYIAQQGYCPALILSSDSRRTRETVELLLPALPSAPKVQFEKSLYLADWPVLLEEVRLAPAKATPLLLVGHNPGMQQFALALTLKHQSPLGRARAEAIAKKYSTAALAVFDFAFRDWDEVRPGSGTLADYMRPRDLPDKG